jgi:hypothetical protein
MAIIYDNDGSRIGEVGSAGPSPMAATLLSAGLAALAGAKSKT